MTKPSAVCGAKNMNIKGVLLLMSPKAAMIWGCTVQDGFPCLPRNSKELFCFFFSFSQINVTKKISLLPFLPEWKPFVPSQRGCSMGTFLRVPAIQPGCWGCWECWALGIPGLCSCSGISTACLDKQKAVAEPPVPNTKQQQLLFRISPCGFTIPLRLVHCRHVFVSNSSFYFSWDWCV